MVIYKLSTPMDDDSQTMPDMAKKGVARQQALADPGFVRRLRELAADYGIDNPADFARFLGVSPQTGHKWWAGGTKNISAKDLFLIADKFGVRTRWLLQHSGPKKLNALQSANEGWEVRFLETYRAASESEREIPHAWIKNQEAKVHTNKKSG